jgi:hypothetical protein
MVVPLVLIPHPTLVLLLMLNPVLSLCKQVNLINKVIESLLLVALLPKRKVLLLLLPGKFCVVSDQPTSVTSAAIATTAKGIFVPASSMYTRVFC